MYSMNAGICWCVCVCVCVCVHTYIYIYMYRYTDTQPLKARSMASLPMPIASKICAACNSGLRQYLCFCTSSCVSICTLVLANLVRGEERDAVLGHNLE